MQFAEPLILSEEERVIGINLLLQDRPDLPEGRLFFDALHEVDEAVHGLFLGSQGAVEILLGGSTSLVVVLVSHVISLSVSL
jgi:hypothetical protein